MEIINLNEIINFNNNDSNLETFIFPDSNIFLYDIDIKINDKTTNNSAPITTNNSNNSTTIVLKVVDEEKSKENDSNIGFGNGVDEGLKEIDKYPIPQLLIIDHLKPKEDESLWVPISIKNKISNGMTQLFRNVPHDCPICWEECFETYSFPFCEHTYCLSCVKSHLTEQIWKNKANSNLSCPDPKCKSTITLIDLESLVDREVYEKFLLFSKIKEKYYGNNKIIFCINCDNPLSVTEVDKEIRCDNPECNCDICIECYTFTHPGIECTENKENIYNCMTEDDKKTMELFKNEQIKECPKCKRYVFKENGCEHVTCLTCSYQFCYYCLEPHDHILSTHVHGPLYQVPINDPYSPHVFRHRNIHKRRFKKVLKYFGFTLLVIIGLGPAIIVGGGFVAGTLLVSPFYGIYLATQHHKHSKKLRKSKSFRIWCVQEKKRREDLGLEVSAYINENAILN